MIFLGLIVAAVALGVGAAVVLDNTASVSITLLNHDVPGITSMWQVFVAGAVLAIVFMSGVIVVAVGVGRAVRVRRELRELRDEHEESLTTLQMQKQQLQRELARARREHGSVPGSAPGSVPAPATAPGQDRRVAPGGGGPMAASPFFDSTS